MKTPFEQRVDELLAANNELVDRTRVAEAAVRRLSVQIRALKDIMVDLKMEEFEYTKTTAADASRLGEPDGCGWERIGMPVIVVTFYEGECSTGTSVEQNWRRRRYHLPEA